MRVNGMGLFLEKRQSLQEFLIEQGYNPNHVAVELNGEVIPKKAYDTVILTDDDVIEIVRFVGGG